MRLKKSLLTVLATGIFGISAAQTDKYPKDYFRNPLAIPILLAGNFGECRPNHFHSGIDIKTLGKENLAVYAAAEGYISRLKLEKGGFGHAIYITHPNGYTTVYAHLNSFDPVLQKMVVDEQYKTENWQVDIQLDSLKYPVKKGQQIALSGNTGASTAPHLHFEIRKTKSEHPLNPMLFGLPIIDKLPPKPVQLAVYDMTKGIYEQEPLILNLKKKGKVYSPIKDTVKVYTNEPVIGINVNDYMDGSDNTLTYYTASLYMNDALMLTVRLDNIGYDETRYLHSFIDYKTRKTKGIWIQGLYEQINNQLSHIYEYPTAYRQFSEKGKIEASVGSTKRIKVVITDANGNSSDIGFYMKFYGPVPGPVSQCDKPYKFTAAKLNNFANTNVAVMLDKKALYENMCFYYDRIRDAESYSDRYVIGHSYIPSHTYFELFIKADKPIPFNLRDKIAMVYADGKNETGMGTTYEDDWYKIKTRNFGEYRLVADTSAPVIKSLQKENAVLVKAGSISFNVKEDITSIKSFRGELDGKWVCFEQKGDNFIYTFDEHCAPGKHVVIATAIDENNNSRTFTYNFTR